MGEPQDESENTDLGFEVVNMQVVGILTNSTSHGKSVDLGFGVGNSQGVGIFEHSSGVQDQVQRLEDDIRNQLDKPFHAAKKKISEDVRRKKFQFRKRGTLMEEEDKELS